ncbi:DNA ligase [Streptomyces ossamyceticus]|nr:DNA ligase [Streptomyces ossamyceticus]
MILDGEAAVYIADADGTAHISFAAVQSRALSRPARARELADHPATYVAFDVLAHPAAGFPDLRSRPYSERRQVLLDVLADVGPPIESVWSTIDRSEALLWSAALEGTGVEGIVAKPLNSVYRASRIWSKVRHADTVDIAVVGFTCTARHPKALAVQLPDGRVALSQRLTTALASAVGPRLVPHAGRAFTNAGDSYTPAGGNAVVEVVAGTSRHTVVTVARLR